MFKAGDTVYTLDGRQVEYVGAAGPRHLVAELYETDQGDYRGQEFIADAVFAVPPTLKLHAEVKELEEKANALRLQIWEAQTEAREAEKDNANRLKYLAKFAPLKRVEDFVNGKITHCVMTTEYGRGVSVMTVADALRQPDKYDRDMKLLSLFGGSKGDLQWRVNRYSDGSGSGWTDCEPFCSEEEAKERAIEILNGRIAEEETANKVWGRDVMIQCAETLGVPVPEWLLTRHTEAVRLNAEKAVETKRAELAKAEEALAAVR